MNYAVDNWYDYPQYWEMAFAEDTKPESDFIEAACAKYAARPVKRMLEPGCGSGRLVMEMTRRGYQMAGLDLNVPSLEFLRGRLSKRGWKAEILEADMADFQLKRPVDCAFNTFSTFRHLLTETAAESHLRAVAAALRPGGLYLLGLHLLPPDAALECTERWRAERGKTKVVYTFRVTGTDLRKRFESIRVNLLVKRPQGNLKLVTEFNLRTYTARQLRGLLAKVPEFELLDVFDYNYDLAQPLRLNDELSDSILVLRKRSDA